MFASTLQSLSQLAIQEAGVTIPQQADENLLDDIKNRLDNMVSLTETEMYVRPDMVNVVASKRLNKYLIETADLSRFMITNGLTNIKEAVGYILEANGLEGQYHNVALVIDESSILDEMDNLGYIVSDFNLQTPPKGLGLAMVGHQKDFAKIRNIANTKELMDLVTGRYGLPLVKRNYKSVGLLNHTTPIQEATVKDEDVQIKAGKNDQVIHEKEDKDDDKPAKYNPLYLLGRGLGYITKRADQGFSKEYGGVRLARQAGYGHLNKQHVVAKEDVDYDEMSLHEQHIQYLKDVASGKYDED